jgi:RNA polymerase sporulation-specific sigma factor
MNNKVVICGVNTSTLPKISQKECDELLEKIKLGDQGAREQFIVANMRLVLSVIKRFWSKKKSSDDVFQAGCIGLIKAIDNFDLSFGVKFSTYAVPMIIGEIKRLLRDTNSMRVPRSIRDTAYQVLKTRGELEKEDKDSSLERVAEVMNVAMKEVVYALDAISDTVSIYDPIYNKSGDELLLVDQIGDQKCTDENWTENVAIQTAMTKLGERERKIIYLRYFEGKTQTEISSEVGISQAQVSRLEKNALYSIRQNIN